MSLSPSYRERAMLPQQPRPPAHWPQECTEIMTHAWLRVWRCTYPGCGQMHEYRRENLPDVIGLACYGDGVSIVREDVA